MSSFNKMFQEEVRRLARKEAKTAVDKLEADVASLKKSNVELKRRLADLERVGKRLKKKVAKIDEVDGAVAPEAADNARFTGKTIRMMRKKLGLTQTDFATLAGVSGQSVYQWETRDDRIAIRGEAKGRLVAMKKMGKREAAARLGEM